MKKICSKCKEEKSLNMFYKRKNSKDGYTGVCSSCESKRKKTYRKNNPEKSKRERVRFRIINYFKKLYPNNYKKINSKICSKCKNKQGIGQFHKNNTTYDGLYSYCKKCSKTLGKKFSKDNKNQIYLSKRAYYNKQVEELGDYYIKQALLQGTNLKSGDIPQWLIEAKRQEIKLKRTIEKGDKDERQKTSK